MCLQDNRVFRRHEMVINNREGRRVTLSFNAFPLHRSEGEPLGAALVFMDVSTLKDMEARLRQQDHLSILGQMAAKIAHEVKNPLFAIMGLADELQEDEKDPDRGHLIDMIGREANLCNQWISGMLSFSKAPTAAAVAAEPSYLHLPEHLHRLLGDFTRTNGRENLRLVEDYEEDLPEIKMTFDQLRHVFTNLFENAFHAMPQGGVLTVRARNYPGRPRGGAGGGHRHRHQPGHPAQHLRALLYQQGRRHRPGAGHRAEDHPGHRGLHRRTLAGERGYHIYPETSGKLI